MGKMISYIIALVLVYLFVSSILVFMFIGVNNPFYKFKIEEPKYSDEIRHISINSESDKYALFFLYLTWPLFVVFYYIPIALFKMFKFLINFIGWFIAKLFKL